MTSPYQLFFYPSSAQEKLVARLVVVVGITAAVGFACLFIYLLVGGEKGGG